jgi:hypothetical protein
VATEADPAELIGRHADASLLRTAELPRSLGQPDLGPERAAPGWIIPLGVTLTGVTLILGVALTGFGVVDGLASGFDVYSLLALIVGIVLAGTHWGWVHVAEATANHRQGRGDHAQLELGHQWLAGISPYTRHEVLSAAGEDGSITIVERRYVPVPVGDDAFTFRSEVIANEEHPADAPSAVVAERAELLRHRAAAATARERQRYEAAADAYEQSRLRDEDEAERRAAARAASEVLAERINANLGDPPLIE